MPLWERQLLVAAGLDLLGWNDEQQPAAQHGFSAHDIHVLSTPGVG